MTFFLGALFGAFVAWCYGEARFLYEKRRADEAWVEGGEHPEDREVGGVGRCPDCGFYWTGRDACPVDGSWLEPAGLRP